jgi:hypothetical protein
MEQAEGLKTRYSGPTVIRTIWGKCGLNYLGIRITKVKLGVIGNIQQSSLSAKLKCIEAEMLYLTIYDGDNNNNNYNNNDVQ